MMSRAKRLDKATGSSSSSVSPDSSAGETRARGHAKSTGLLVLCSSWSDEVSSLHLPHGVCVRVARVCHGCAAEPQRRQRNRNELAGQRARANWQARREAWARKEHERRSKTPLTTGVREQGDLDPCQTYDWLGVGNGYCSCVGCWLTLKTLIVRKLRLCRLPLLSMAAVPHFARVLCASRYDCSLTFLFSVVRIF